jgi:hypothetical protein
LPFHAGKTQNTPDTICLELFPDLDPVLDNPKSWTHQEHERKRHAVTLAGGLDLDTIAGCNSNCLQATAHGKPAVVVALDALVCCSFCNPSPKEARV